MSYMKPLQSGSFRRGTYGSPPRNLRMTLRNLASQPEAASADRTPGMFDPKRKAVLTNGTPRPPRCLTSISDAYSNPGAA